VCGNKSKAERTTEEKFLSLLIPFRLHKNIINFIAENMPFVVVAAAIVALRGQRDSNQRPATK